MENRRRRAGLPLVLLAPPSHGRLRYGRQTSRCPIPATFGNRERRHAGKRENPRGPSEGAVARGKRDDAQGDAVAMEVRWQSCGATTACRAWRIPRPKV